MFDIYISGHIHFYCHKVRNKCITLAKVRFNLVK